MDAVLRTKVIWGVLLLCGGAIVLKTCHDSNVAQEQSEQQQLFRKKNVAPLLRRVNDATAPRSTADASPFDATDFLSRLSDYEKRTAAQRRDLEEIYASLREKQGTKQPDNVCKQWENQWARLQSGKIALDAQQEEAQGLYDTQLQHWVDAAAQTQNLQSHADELDMLATELQSLLKTVVARRSGVDNDGAAYTGYTIDLKRIRRRLKLLEQKKAEWEAITKAAVETRAAVVTDDGKVNRAGEPIRKADSLLASILRDPDCDATSLAKPTILPAPPPPPFVPDIRIVTTGDLADSLLEPLVNQWLKARQATPLEGHSFTWNIADENTREIEVRVPEQMQGAEQGVLRIRVTTESNSASVFTHLLAGGDADLVLTGRKMSKQMESKWLPQGKTLETMDPTVKGRAYRTRVCSDALLFFRGNDMDVEMVSTHVLARTPKVFSADDAGRAEAAALFGLRAEAADLRTSTADRTTSAITREHPGHLFLGTWHQDALNHNPGQALSASGPSALGYSTGWEDEVVLNNIPAEYRPVATGCVPTDDSIVSGQYAFSYNITFYRSTQDNPKAAAAADLMVYAGDVTNPELVELVRLRGFAPLQLKLSEPNNTLTDQDLPLAMVIRQMESAGLDMGYDADACSWVYGVRIPIPLYYAVGSATSDGKKSVEIDPDSRYYTEAQGLQVISKMTQGRKACLVLVGHADPQWGKKLDISKESWRKNLLLSAERAKGVYKTLFHEILGGNAQLGKVQLGTSWARPVVDLHLEQSVEEQESALERCRRVDIFLIFPMSEE